MWHQVKTWLARFTIGALLAGLALIPTSPAAATLCNDGWVSPSNGRGTCSHHDGIAYGGYMYVPQKPPQPAKAVKFSSCKTLKAKYPAGIAKSNSYIAKASLLKTPKVWGAMYDLNKKLDTNKNGLICESLYVPSVLSPSPSSSPTPSPLPTASKPTSTPAAPSPSASNPAPVPSYTYTPEKGTVANPYSIGSSYLLRSTSGIEIKVVGSQPDVSVEACKIFFLTGCASKSINGIWTNIGFTPDSGETIIAISVSVTNSTNAKWVVTNAIDYVRADFGTLVWIQQSNSSSEYSNYFDIAPNSARTVRLFIRTSKSTNYSAWSLLVADGGYTAYMKIN